ncbi:MAG: BrnA antitoxin family protein [Nostoc sp. NMS7]|uniref:BrnA antitoxin family protein n=1 Tax=Nostoc sp. NMS7 TaxID=2815391 RepID=UPI0025D43F86|nr:BrnA antitoxin family protein [Nostoc sp. NMS7]MBN3946370.1 BrnA antitoxin family protein [Nostoc sp. NMS7]
MSDKNLRNTSGTNWTALESMNDEEIDYSDIPPLTEDFFQKATLRVPAPQAQHVVQIEPDILEWFQAQSGEYKTLINSVLRRYIKNCEEHRAV